MSRLTLRHKAGLVLTVLTFTLGVVAAAALGWENEDNDKGHDRTETHNRTETNNRTETHTQTTPTTPTVTVTTPTTPTTTAPAPAVPVGPQGAPAQTPGVKVETESEGGGKGRGEGGGKGGGDRRQGGGGPEEVAQQGVPSAGQGGQLAPVAERRKLAKTGIHPGLIALLGALCLGGGALMIRRARTD